MVQRKHRVESFLTGLTVSKCIAYIIVAYAIAVLFRIVYNTIYNESFAQSAPIALCQHNIKLPCHYREFRNEVISGDKDCSYAWNAPAVFAKDVRVNGTNTNDAMSKIKFCTVDTSDIRDIRAQSCSDMYSVWSAFTEGLKSSEAAVSEKVSQLESTVNTNNANVASVRTKMNEAASAMQDASAKATQSSEQLTNIENALRDAQ